MSEQDFETLARDAEQTRQRGETRPLRDAAEPVPALLERFSDALGLRGSWVRVRETETEGEQ